MQSAAPHVISYLLPGDLFQQARAVCWALVAEFGRGEARSAAAKICEIKALLADSFVSGRNVHSFMACAIRVSRNLALRASHLPCIATSSSHFRANLP